MEKLIGVNCYEISEDRLCVIKESNYNGVLTVGSQNGKIVNLDLRKKRKI